MKNRFNLNIHDYIHQAEGKLLFNKQLFSTIAPRYDFTNRVLSFGRDIVWKKRLVEDLPSFTAEHADSSLELRGTSHESRVTYFDSANSAVSAVNVYAPHCLDLACGTGDITFLLAAKYPAGHIVGLDVTEKMITLARSRCAAAEDTDILSHREHREHRDEKINFSVSSVHSVANQKFSPWQKSKETFNNITFIIQDMCKTNFPDESFDIVTGGYALRNAPNLEQALIEIRRVMKPGATAAFLDFSKPPNRFLQITKGMLLKFWGGFWGLLLHRNPQLYTYIAESLKLYPDRVALKQMLSRLGFTNIRSRKHFLGFAETILFQKP
jgi:ubiquinone/menaquinone biosynthesis C-methylase UbiE